MTIVCIRKSLLASLCPVFFGSFDLFLCDKLATVVVLSWQDLRQSTCRGAQSLEQISIREYFYFCRYLMISFHSFPYSTGLWQTEQLRTWGHSKLVASRGWKLHKMPSNRLQRSREMSLHKPPEGRTNNYMARWPMSWPTVVKIVHS